MIKILFKLFIVILLLFPNFIYSQDTIVSYFNQNWVRCNKQFAVYYRKAYPDTIGIWIVKDYYMNGILQMEAKFKNKRLKKREGKAIYYHHNGNISAKGEFKNNKKDGIWQSYYSNGNMSSIGRISSGIYDSVWTYYNLNGTFFGYSNYCNGNLDGQSKWVYESGKTCQIINYKNNQIISNTFFKENGFTISNPEKDCSVEFLGGNNNMVKFLQENLKYPESLRLQQKEGIILFHFIVNKQGEIENIEIQKSDEESFNVEAFRVFNMIKYMRPARSHGRLIDQECTLPIRFKLN